MKNIGLHEATMGDVMFRLKKKKANRWIAPTCDRAETTDQYAHAVVNGTSINELRRLGCHVNSVGSLIDTSSRGVVISAGEWKFFKRMDK